MRLEQIPGCCGIQEIINICDTAGRPEFAAYAASEENAAFFVFSSITNGKTGGKSPGTELAEFIEANGLGTVVKSGPSKNGNTKNKLTMWVWTPDKKALKAWGNKMAKNKEFTEEYDEQLDYGW